MNIRIIWLNINEMCKKLPPIYPHSHPKKPKSGNQKPGVNDALKNFRRGVENRRKPD